MKNEGTIPTIREDSPAQPCLAFSSIWGDRLTEQVGLYWAPSFMLQELLASFPGRRDVPKAGECCLCFSSQVCFLILYCLFVWWMSSRGFYETLRMTLKKICLRENFRNYKVTLVILPRNKNARLEILGSKEYDKGKSEFYRLQLSPEQTCSKSF